MIVFLKGGLGNQLFQLHKALYNWNYNEKIILEKCFLSLYDSPRQFALSFALEENRILERETQFLSHDFFRYIFELLVKLRVITGDKGKGLFSKVYFGYFQSPEYFVLPESKRALELIRCKLLKNIKISQEESLVFYGKIGYHIRLGDRISHKTNILNVVSFLNEKSQHKQIIIFTDSPEMLFEYLDNKNVIFISNYRMSLLQEFIVLMQLDKAFISASSFSLFARILAQGTIEFLPQEICAGDIELVKKFSV